MTKTSNEDVSVIVRGSGVYRVEGEELPFTAGASFRFDPETTRQPIAGPGGCSRVAIGARRGSHDPWGRF